MLDDDKMMGAIANSLAYPAGFGKGLETSLDVKIVYKILHLLDPVLVWVMFVLGFLLAINKVD